MAAQDPKGVVSGLSDAEKQLNAIFGRMSKSGKTTARDLKALDAAFIKIDKESKTVRTSSALLAAALSKVNKETDTFQRGAVTTANKLAESSDLMTDAMEKAHDDQIKLIKDQIGALQKAGGHHREIALLDEKRGQLEMDRFESQKKTSIQLAALQTRQGQVLKGTFNGLSAAIQLRGTQAGKIAGEFFGLSSQGMKAVAGGAGIAAIALLALKFLIEKTAKSAKDAAETGFELGASLNSARAAGTRFSAAVREAGAMAGKGAAALASAIPDDRIIALAAIAQKDYAFGLAGVGREYENTLQMSREQRNETRLQTVNFVGDLAKMSNVLGVTEEEAVRLGTRLGVLSKGNFRDAERATFVLGMEAKRLGVPLENLVSIFTLLATQADFAGSSTSRLTAETLAFTDSVREMARNGVRGLQNLDPEKINRIASSMADFMTKMENNRLIALTMKPGENLESSLNRLEGGTMAMRRDAIQSAMKLMGVNNPGAAGQNMSSFQALAVAKAAGVGGDIVDQIRMGRFLAGGAAGKSLSEDSIKRRMAEMTDAKFDQAKSVGANLSAGADIMQIIAGTLQNILRLMVEMANKITLGGSKTARELNAQFLKEDREQSAKKYSDRNNLYRPQRAMAGVTG